MCLVRRDIFNARPEVDKCSTRHSVYKETIMILDALENADAYNALNSGFAKAFEFLRRDDLAELEEGRHDIDGERVYAMIVKAAGREREVGELEAHEQYIDVQYVISGTDEMGWRPRSSCTQPQAEYNDEDDYQMFSDRPTAWVATEPGTFAIFFPNDPHIPLISAEQLHKAVVKVAVE